MYPYYEALFEHIKQQSDPELFFWLYGGGFFLGVICFIGVPIGCCCMMMKKKKNQAPASHNQVMDQTQVTDNNIKNLPNTYEHQTSGQELEIESIDQTSQDKYAAASKD